MENATNLFESPKLQNLLIFWVKPYFTSENTFSKVDFSVNSESETADMTY